MVFTGAVRHRRYRLLQFDALAHSVEASSDIALHNAMLLRCGFQTIAINGNASFPIDHIVGTRWSSLSGRFRKNTFMFQRSLLTISLSILIPQLVLRQPSRAELLPEIHYLLPRQGLGSARE